MSTWIGGNGDWATAGNWSGGVPNSPTASATLNSADTVTIAGNETFTVETVTLNNVNALLEIDGSLELAGTLSVEAGGLSFGPNGNLIGGKLLLNSDTRPMTSNNGNFQDVTIEGALNLSQNGADQLNVYHGITLEGVNGTGAGAINLSGNNSQIAFIGSQTVTNAKINLGGGASQAQIVIDNVGNNGISQLTLGSTLTITSGGSNVLLTGNGKILNQGKILADTAPTLTNSVFQVSAMTISSAEFVNANLLAISNGDQVLLTSAIFSNTGTITIAGGDSTTNTGSALHLDNDYTTASLGTIKVTGGAYLWIDTPGVLLNTGATFKVGGSNPLSRVILSGSIQGGTIIDAGSTFGSTSTGGLFFNNGELDHVTYSGTLNLFQIPPAPSGTLLPGVVRIYNGLTLAGAATINDTAAGSLIAFLGTQTLAKGTIHIGGATGTATFQVGDIGNQPATLTLGTGVAISTTGLSAVINGAGGPTTLINDGTISGKTAGGHLVIDPNSFVNNGQLVISSTQTVTISPTVFDNDSQGKITLAGSATLIINTPSFVNAGTIAITSAHATLDLQGTLDSDSIGTIDVTRTTKGKITTQNGVVDLQGTLYNTAITVGYISAADGTVQVTLAGTGLILGGKITDIGDQMLNTSGNEIGAGFVYRGGAFDGVTFQGTVDMSAAGSALQIDDGITLLADNGTSPGTIKLTGLNSGLTFYGSQTLSQGTIDIGGATSGGAPVITIADNTSPAATLTLAAGVSIVAVGEFGVVNGSRDTILINRGTITAGVGQGSLTLAPGTFDNIGTITIKNGDTVIISSPNFANTGKISIQNSNLDIEGNYTTGQLGSISQSGSGGTFDILNGSIDNTGHSFTVGTGTAFGMVTLSGAIQYGTIVDKGNGFNFLNGSLDHVTYQGTLTVGNGASLNVLNGITMVNASNKDGGTISVQGSGSALNFQGTQALTTATTILLGSSTSSDVIEITTLGTSLGTVTFGAHVTVTDATGSGNQATATIGGTGRLVNQGKINVTAADGLFSIATFQMVNSGTISIQNGTSMTIGLVDAFTNTGTVSETSGTNTIDIIRAVNGTGGSFTINSGTSAAGSTLEFDGTVSSGQTITFAGIGNRLVLEDSAGFDAVVGGLKTTKAGTNTIDLTDVSFSSTPTLAFNATTDVLTVTNGGTVAASIHLFGSYVAAGFHTAGDGGNGTALTYTAPTPHALQLAAGH